MELDYEQLLSWEDPGPAVPDIAATESDKPWGDGITVSGPNQPLKGRQMVSLMADSYVFRSQEELLRVQKYCRDHGGWQLEQVSCQPKQPWLLVINSCVIGWLLEWSLVPIISLYVLGQRGRQLHVCKCQEGAGGAVGQ